MVILSRVESNTLYLCNLCFQVDMNKPKCFSFKLLLKLLLELTKQFTTLNTITMEVDAIEEYIYLAQSGFQLENMSQDGYVCDMTGCIPEIIKKLHQLIIAGPSITLNI